MGSDAHFLAEDDYFPCLHYFDRRLIELLEKDRNVGFLCGYVEEINDVQVASIANGIMRGADLPKICTPKYPHHPNPQIEFSYRITKLGKKVKDYIKVFSTPFCTGSGMIRVFGEDSREEKILMPIIVPSNLG